MAKVEIKMPKMGESITEATILSWLKGIGEEIEAEESLLEIATDKIDSEVPAPTGGKLLEIMFKEGDVVPVGATIAIIETVGTEETDAISPANGHTSEEEEVESTIPFLPKEEVIHERIPVSSSAVRESDRFYSPLVQNIAKEEGISFQELEQIPGSGRKGRVTKKDILYYVANRKSPTVPEVSSKPMFSSPAPTTISPSSSSNGFHIAERSFTHHGNIEIEEMDRMRKMIADNMLYSQHISAHVTSFVEADVTPVVLWRKKVKEAFFNTYNEKLTFTPIFVHVVAKVLRELPRLNASVQGDQILLKKDIHIGIAVALPSDNLIVPVVKHADKMNLAGLTSAINDLASRARKNKLTPSELEGGTYTLSNVGTFGNVMGTPIIMQPQVAILATGAIRKLPAVVETPEGDMIGIRHKMFLSHSYDHRIIDGALGGKFVRRVGDYLENWDMNQGF
ncbi:MAG: dihydrolipoamide acetyltransferase family protein [Bacteroidota bacterium]